jgi:hypothetical protein
MDLNELELDQEHWRCTEFVEGSSVSAAGHRRDIGGTMCRI